MQNRKNEFSIKNPRDEFNDMNNSSQMGELSDSLTHSQSSLDVSSEVPTQATDEQFDAKIVRRASWCPGTNANKDKNRNPLSRSGFFRPNSEPNSPRGVIKVFLAEDNIGLAMTAKMAITKAVTNIFPGSTVTIDHAKDGEEALKAMQTNQYDLCVMDDHMPGKEGHVVVEEIRAEEIKNNQSPRLIISCSTSHLDGKGEQTAFRGADDFFQKPVNLANVQTVLKKRLSNLETIQEEGEIEPQNTDTPSIAKREC